MIAGDLSRKTIVNYVSKDNGDAEVAARLSRPITAISFDP